MDGFLTLSGNLLAISIYCRLLAFEERIVFLGNTGLLLLVCHFLETVDIGFQVGRVLVLVS
jgi:hypothetical protein